MRAVALVDFPYDGKSWKAGDELEVQQKDVHVLKVYGRIEIVAEDETPPPKKRRAYKRRDMRAEE